jgi:hypothetical protein
MRRVETEKSRARGVPAITGYLYEFVNLSFLFYGADFFQFASAASMYILFKDSKPPEERT